MPTNIQQVWFPGVHCDVGGGYFETQAGLSKITLRWMINHAQAAGLIFNPQAIADLLPVQDTPTQSAPRVDALVHESLKGWWWIVEFIPKRIRDPAASYAQRWTIHAGRSRFVSDGANIHSSVLQRRKLVPNYCPTNLPADFKEVA
jgi:hypothetical protein